MRSMYIKALAILCCCLFACSVFANDHRQIRRYVQQNFPAAFVINDAQISQLAWAFHHDKHTNDLDLRKNHQDIYVEISRALTRLYCAQLLRSGTLESYNRFVAAQSSVVNAKPLTFASYTKLSQHVQSLSAADYSLLETAAILSAVSLSKPAAALAQRAMDITPHSNDNMSFLAATLRNGINIYPLTAQIMRDDAAARKLLYVLFPPQTNFRHMLYTEGGIGMFKYLRNMIAHNFIDKESLNLWSAHWIINIAGFRGHIDQRGSIYLNENVAASILSLKTFVYEMLEQPNFDPLLPYLEFRAKALGFRDLPTEERLFYTHIGCLLRLYNIEEGKRLQASIQRIPVENIRAIKRYFLQGLHDPNQNTHLYVPALLGNALEVSNGNLEQVIEHMLPVYDAVLQQAARQNIHKMSFNKLSASKNLKQLLNINPDDPKSFKILPDGTVLLG